MSLSSDEYKKMGEAAVPKTKSVRNLAGAFIIGGAICVLGQFILNFYLDIGLSTPIASTSCSITLIGISAVLTGFGIYDKIAKFGGAGALVPITGFANWYIFATINSNLLILKYHLPRQVLLTF